MIFLKGSFVGLGKYRWFLALIGTIALVVMGHRLMAPPSASVSSELQTKTRTLPFNHQAKLVGNLPLFFQPNVGQTDSSVDFLAKTRDSTVFLTPDGATLLLQKQASSSRIKGLAHKKQKRISN